MNLFARRVQTQPNGQYYLMATEDKAKHTTFQPPSQKEKLLFIVNGSFDQWHKNK